MTMTMTIPFGRSKGTPISEAEAKDIGWIIQATEAKLDEEPESRYAGERRALVEACRAELERRKGGGERVEPGSDPRAAAAAPASPAPLARRGETRVAGGYADAAKLSATLLSAAREYHVISPATACGALPHGCEVAISLVEIDTRDLRDGGEVYNLAGKMGLGKSALDRIAGAAGVSWDPAMSGRLDDGRDPHYCHYRAVGHVRLFDGSLRTLTGEVEIDARDGSPQLDEIVEKARAARGGPRDPSGQIRELRKFLLRHAESKAKNRAIRSLGLRTAYAPEDLKKPFAVARLMFTGHSDDPVLRAAFASKIADSMLGATTAMFGAPAAPRLAAPTTSVGHAPPPVGAVVETDAWGEDERY
jgi:hypothetical protein